MAQMLILNTIIGLYAALLCSDVIKMSTPCKSRARGQQSFTEQSKQRLTKVFCFEMVCIHLKFHTRASYAPQKCSQYLMI